MSKLSAPNVSAHHHRAGLNVSPQTQQAPTLDSQASARSSRARVQQPVPGSTSAFVRESTDGSLLQPPATVAHTPEALKAYRQEVAAVAQHHHLDLSIPGEAAQAHALVAAKARKGTSTASVDRSRSYTRTMDRLATKMEHLIGRSTAFGHTVQHRCLQNVQDAWASIGGGNKARWGTAAEAGNAIDGNLHHGPAPRGAILLWNSSVGGGAGHIAVSDGHGHAINNWGGNVIEKTPLSQMQGGYRGWVYPAALGHRPQGAQRGWLHGDGVPGPATQRR